MEDLIEVQNNGPELIHTNYWITKIARKGYLFLSINAGCFRLLVPPANESELKEMRTGEIALITRGAWPKYGKADAIEILFEDFSDAPYCLYLSSEQCPTMPLDRDIDKQDQPPRWKLAIYTMNGKLFEMPARYRKADALPFMKQW